eukprot:Colp12_sorted_trinity150504_noHs@3255
MSTAAVLLHAAELLERERGGDFFESEMSQSSTQLNGGSKKRNMKNREIHNLLEKNRRAHLKECFTALRMAVPTIDSAKTSTVAILRHATEYIYALEQRHDQQAKELEQLKRIKAANLTRLSEMHQTAIVGCGHALESGLSPQTFKQEPVAVADGSFMPASPPHSLGGHSCSSTLSLG